MRISSADGNYGLESMYPKTDTGFLRYPSTTAMSIINGMETTHTSLVSEHTLLYVQILFKRKNYLHLIHVCVYACVYDQIIMSVTIVRSITMSVTKNSEIYSCRAFILHYIILLYVQILFKRNLYITLHNFIVCKDFI